MTDAAEQQRRYKEYLELLPLTNALAGLPASEHGKYYTEEQLEARVFTVRHAFKAARAIAPNSVENQRKYREFIDLLPQTISLAGLPTSEHGRYFTEEQIEARIFTVRHANKTARQLARECIKA